MNVKILFSLDIVSTSILPHLGVFDIFMCRKMLGTEV